APDQQDIGSMERFAHGVDSFDGKIDIVNLFFFSIGRIFYRQTGDSSFSAKAGVLRAPIRFVGVSVFEIGVYRNVSGFDQFLYVREHVVTRDRAIRQTAREREPRRRPGRPLESEVLQ